MFGHRYTLDPHWGSLIVDPLSCPYRWDEVWGVWKELFIDFIAYVLPSLDDSTSS